MADWGTAYYLDPQSAQHILNVLQPIQIGYGAVLLSFLGAIHWGLEFAGVGGQLVLPLPHISNPLYVNPFAGIPSVLSGYLGSCISLANPPSPHKFRTSRSIPRVHGDVLGR